MNVFCRPTGSLVLKYSAAEGRVCNLTFLVKSVKSGFTRSFRNNTLTWILRRSGGMKVTQIKRLWTLSHFHTHKVSFVVLLQCLVGSI